MSGVMAITMGDAAGIGPEIIAAYMAQNRPAGLFVIGDCGQMRRAERLRGLEETAYSITEAEIAQLSARPWQGVPVLEVGSLPADLPYGCISAKAGHLAHQAILRAIALAKTGQIDAMVTAPIHKEALKAAGILHPGHTEILAEETGTADFGMMLVEGDLRVILVSIHLSLRDALDKVTIQNLRRTFRLAESGAKALGIAAPRIAVAGLNPHAGEGGLFGREEIEIITPAIAAARAEEGMDISGPYPPDTVFMRARRGAFDVVVAQYHDQGLIPVKLNGIEKGVNITIGLPIIRTSVDHGTAFDVAGKGIADCASLAEAVDVARRMVLFRQDHAQKKARKAGF
jgi:4-hydroxythreonine-4-phosphate dehydrogenase